MAKITHVARVLLYFLPLFYMCRGEMGVLFARGSGSAGDWEDHYCVFYNPAFRKLPHRLDDAPSYPLTDLSSDLGCQDSTAYDKVKASGTIVAVTRGNCTFVEKGSVAQTHGSAGLLVLSSSIVTPASNSSFHVNISIATIKKNDYAKIKKLGPQVDVKLYAPELRDEFDPCMVIVFLLAVGCVTVGGYWSGIKKQEKFLKQRLTKGRKRRKSNEKKDDNSDDDDDDDEESINLTLPAIAVFVLLSSTVLVLLFFYDYLVYVVIGLFCLAGTAGMYSCLIPLWKLIPVNSRLPATKVPCLSGRPFYKNLLLCALCCGFSVFWLVERNTSYSWVMQDILGVAFCINVLRLVHMPNIKICGVLLLALFVYDIFFVFITPLITPICGVLLLALFVYDIFFVFITPLITPSGKSVMIDVATGGSSHSGEQLPMVFKVPRLTSSPLNVCVLSPSLLGFGDIIIPGFLVAFNHAIDLKVQSRRKIYFVSTVIGYSVGLILTFIALYVMKSGQPALLYLVPCTLITTLVIGCCRGEMKILWNGDKKCPKKDDDQRTEGQVTVPPSGDPENVIGDNVSVDRSSISSDASESRELLHK